MFIFTLANLPFAFHGVPRISWVSMGRPFAPNRIPRHFFRAAALVALRQEALGVAITRGSLAAPLVVISTHVRIRTRQADKWRYHLAQSHRSHVSLRNAAFADLD